MMRFASYLVTGGVGVAFGLLLNVTACEIHQAMPRLGVHLARAARRITPAEARGDVDPVRRARELWREALDGSVTNTRVVAFGGHELAVATTQKLWAEYRDRLTRRLSQGTKVGLAVVAVAFVALVVQVQVVDNAAADRDLARMTELMQGMQLEHPEDADGFHDVVEVFQDEHAGRPLITGPARNTLIVTSILFAFMVWRLETSLWRRARVLDRDDAARP